MSTQPIIEGKTKTLSLHPRIPEYLIARYKDEITKNDDPSQTKKFAGKAMHSNTVNEAVMKLMAKHGIPTAFVERISDTEFLTLNCKMIPLELIMRGHAFGSFLNRHPELTTEGVEPHKFEKICLEFFLKTSSGKVAFNGTTLAKGLNTAKGEEDPFIVNHYEQPWVLAHSKQPGPALLNMTVDPTLIFGNKWMAKVIVLEKIMADVFMALDAEWSKQKLHLIDMKIEFGITPDGRLVVADVIDPDSWRLLTEDWTGHLDKQAFRNCEAMSEIANKYALLARLVQNFDI